MINLNKQQKLSWLEGHYFWHFCHHSDLPQYFYACLLGDRHTSCIDVYYAHCTTLLLFSMLCPLTHWTVTHSYMQNSLFCLTLLHIFSGLQLRASYSHTICFIQLCKAIHYITVYKFYNYTQVSISRFYAIFIHDLQSTVQLFCSLLKDCDGFSAPSAGKWVLAPLA